MSRRVLQASLAILVTTALTWGAVSPAVATVSPPPADELAVTETQVPADPKLTEAEDETTVTEESSQDEVSEPAPQDPSTENTSDPIDNAESSLEEAHDHDHESVVESPEELVTPPTEKKDSANVATPKTFSNKATSIFALPLASKSYRVSSHWGYRCPSRVGAGIYHNATDMAAADGTPIYAVMAGTVTVIQEPVNATTAGTIVVEHGTVGGKKLTTSYTHSWEPSKFVRVGQKVQKGQKIAEVGSSGVSSGPHLHFVVRQNNVDIDPIPYLKTQGLDLVANATSAVKPLAPIDTCNVYTNGVMGLKASANATSATVLTIPNGTNLKVKPMVPVKGHVKVSYSGKTGYIMANTLSPKPRVSAPVLPKTGSTDKGFVYTINNGATQNFRDFPSLVLGETAIIDTLAGGDRFVATGRTVKNQGYNWQEFTFEGRTGWVLMNNSFRILVENPQGTTTNSSLTNKSKTVSATVLYTQPTKNSYAKSNVKLTIKSGTKVTSTGKVYGTWAQVKYSNKLYWTPTSTLKNPPAQPKPKANPSIKVGDVVARDSAGKLWNYTNLNSKPSARKLIGSGWKGAKSINVTDFNADGVLDIVANFTDGKLYVYLGKTTGGFTKKQIGSSGWQSLEVHLVKMKKTDKYPSIVTRTPAGALNLYSNTGSAIKFKKAIGSGWKGFSYINFGYFDSDSNADVLAQTKAGQVLLYRTNGSAFVNEKRKTVGTGWKSLRPAVGAHHHGSKTTGLVSVLSNGKLLYYALDGKSRFIAGKTIGSGGWGPMTVARQSL